VNHGELKEVQTFGILFWYVYSYVGHCWSELQVVNKTGQAILLKEDDVVRLIPELDEEASSELLPINFTGLSKPEVIALAQEA
ncbi:hypothetical protein Dimus_037433, partial [Dionaea muscipula]